MALMPQADPKAQASESQGPSLRGFVLSLCAAFVLPGYKNQIQMSEEKIR